MLAIQAKELFHLYRAPRGDVAALRGLSLEVAEGEVVSVLGPSGSGKTTLLTLCSGFARPSSGELAVLGLSFGNASSRELTRTRRASIGIVRQHYHLALPRELTVEEIVALPLRLLGCYCSEERRRVGQLVRAAGLEKRARARPAELSGGEQQRVAICAALAKRPKLILADEPTGELDRRATAAVIELLLELASDVRAAALIVTHDPEVALATERTIHIRDGRLAAEGTTRPVLIIDEQGWLRLPRRLREQAGLQERVRAEAKLGEVRLLAEDLAKTGERAQGGVPLPRIGPEEKRYETEVALDRVDKRYGRKDEAVIAGLSWTFRPEQLHVVAGPSGSGKTTLLNLMAALDRPDSGEVWVGGERVDSLSANNAAAGVSGSLAISLSTRPSSSSSPRARTWSSRSRFAGSIRKKRQLEPSVGSSGSASPSSPTAERTDSPEASNAAYHSREPSPPGLAFCSPTSRPPISTGSLGGW